MPREVFDREEFLRIVERAFEVRVKRIEKEGIAKVKARTRGYLYTIKIPLKELDKFIAKVQERNREATIVYLD